MSGESNVTVADTEMVDTTFVTEAPPSYFDVVDHTCPPPYPGPQSQRPQQGPPPSASPPTDPRPPPPGRGTNTMQSHWLRRPRTEQNYDSDTLSENSDIENTTNTATTSPPRTYATQSQWLRTQSQWLRRPRTEQNYDTDTLSDNSDIGNTGPTVTAVTSQRPHTHTQARPSTQDKPSNFICLSLFNTFCCCWPLGLLALVYSIKVDSAWENGRVDEAKQYSHAAKGWNATSFIFGLLMFIGTGATIILLRR